VILIAMNRKKIRPDRSAKGRLDSTQQPCDPRLCALGLTRLPATTGCPEPAASPKLPAHLAIDDTNPLLAYRLESDSDLSLLRVDDGSSFGYPSPGTPCIARRRRAPYEERFLGESDRLTRGDYIAPRTSDDVLLGSYKGRHL
jgi:hypothetical protein